jgi:hypothetical protein
MPPPTPTLPHQGGGSLVSPSPTRGEGKTFPPPQPSPTRGEGETRLPPPLVGEGWVGEKGKMSNLPVPSMYLTLSLLWGGEKKAQLLVPSRTGQSLP